MGTHLLRTHKYSNMTSDAQRAIILVSTVMAFSTNYAQGKITPAYRLALHLHLQDSTLAQRNHYYTKIAKFAVSHVKQWGRFAARRYCEIRSVPIAYYCKARHDLACAKALQARADLPILKSIVTEFDNSQVPSFIKPQATQAHEI